MTEAITNPEVIRTSDSAAVRLAALSLAPRERVALAHELWESVEGLPDSELEPCEPIHVSDELIAECQRRLERYDRGETKAVDGDEVFRRLRAKYRS